MPLKKILVTYGTRPEAIKFAPLIHELYSRKDNFSVVICSTAQHRDMLDQVNTIFDLKPDIDLNLMKNGQDLTDITNGVLSGMRNVIKEVNPDLILVHGDTTTTLATSIAGFYNNVNVAHVEAGLRTYNIKEPFPEEFNRQVVSKIAKWHFVPTMQSYENLIEEKIASETILLTGNTVIDSLYWMLNKIDSNTKIKADIENKLFEILGFSIYSKKYILITAHRRENFGEGILEIIKSIKKLSSLYPNINFIYPVHKNPNILIPVEKLLSNIENVYLIEPLSYEELLLLLKNCYFVLTDSGGLQEEAPSLKKPVLVLRDVTERPEAIIGGTARLVGANYEVIIKNCKALLDNESEYNKMANNYNPFGDGTASIQIADFIQKKLI
jgi:UDP-N-acetylglucosamine 2-epimerase (non-hydrolysing)